MKNIFKLFILLITPFLLISCEDEDDNYDITTTLILGNWIPFEAQQGRNNIYEWNHDCGNDYLEISDTENGAYNLHFDNCTQLLNSSFTYRLKNGFIYLLKPNEFEEYKLKIVKLTATELTLTDPEDWQENYIKFRK